MPSVFADQQRNTSLPAGTVVRITVFALFFGLFLASAGFFRLLQHPWRLLLLLSVLAWVNVVLLIIVDRNRYEWFYRLLFFILTLLITLGIWGWLDQGFVSLLTLFFNHNDWVLVAAVTGGLAQRLAKLLCRLYSRPQAVQTEGEENTNRIDLSGWQEAWDRWRGTMAALAGVALLVILIRSFTGTGWIQDVWTTLFLFGLLGAGAILYADAFLCMRQAVWTGEFCEWAQDIFKLWLKWFVGVFGVLMLVSWALPAKFSHSLNVSKLIFSEVQVDHDLILSPPGPELPETDVTTELTWSELIFSYLYFLGHLTAFGGVGILMIIFPFVLLGYCFYHLGRQRGMGLCGILAVLGRFWQNWWRRLFQKPGEQRTGLFVPDGGQQGKERPVYYWGRGSNAVVRRGYFHLITEARAKGLAWRGQQTPEETAEKLQTMLPGEEAAIREITGTYHRARYGPPSLARELAAAFENLRWRLQSLLKNGPPAKK